MKIIKVIITQVLIGTSVSFLGIVIPLTNIIEIIGLTIILETLEVLIGLIIDKLRKVYKRL